MVDRRQLQVSQTAQHGLRLVLQQLLRHFAHVDHVHLVLVTEVDELDYRVAIEIIIDTAIAVVFFLFLFELQNFSTVPFLVFRKFGDAERSFLKAA
jgi:hypothetical protein